MRAFLWAAIDFPEAELGSFRLMTDSYGFVALEPAWTAAKLASVRSLVDEWPEWPPVKQRSPGTSSSE
jgi:hypothetical protein